MKFITDIYSYLVLPIDETDPEKGKILWLIRLRWIFLFIQFILVIPVLMLSPTPIKKLVLYVGVCSILFVFNTILFGVWKKITKPFPSVVTYVCLILDLTWFSVLFWFLTKEMKVHVENIYFIHAILGAILLSGRKSIFFYLLIALNFLAIQIGQYNFWPEVGFVPMAFFNQAVLFGVWGITRSVSRYVFSQREKLTQMKLYAEKMDRLRAVGALTAGFSHEFASPLNTVKLRLNRMSRKGTHSPEDLEYALHAVDACENVIKKINLSQLDKRDYVFQKVNIQIALKEIIENWKLDHPKATVELNVESIVPREIKMPVINFSQGILNVLDNSVESSPEKSIIKIDINVDENRLIISVKDNGEGFSKDVLERFGEPFVTTKKQGTGLGLYSFQLFAESIGGSIKISNLLPRGANVIFMAPLNVLNYE